MSRTARATSRAGCTSGTSDGICRTRRPEPRDSAQELQLAGRLPTATIPVALPGRLGLWFPVFPTVESPAAQALVAALVIGSYVVAEEIRVKRPRRAARFAREAAG